MKRIWIPAALIVVAFYFAGCGNKQQGQNQQNSTMQDTGRQAYINDINAIETKLKNSTTIDTYNANLAITAYSKFAGHYPNDTLSPVFLFKAGNMAMSSEQYQRAISIYDNILAKYPSFRQIPDCIFVEGFIYDDYLKDTAKAHVKYSEVVSKYPNTILAQNASAAINDLGKSNEEIMKEFDEKNKKEKKQ